MMKRIAAARLSRERVLRSPNATNANNVYYVNTSGSNTNNNANNAYGVSPDRMTDCAEQSGGSKPIIGAETPQICKELLSLPRIHRAANKNRRRRQRESDVPAIGSDPFSFDNLVRAVHSCTLGVGWKNSVMRWKIDLIPLCCKLERDLKNGRYRLSKYVIFEVFSPKRRTIRSLHFRDRAVQRAMCNAGLYHDLTRGNIYDNGACQNRKGTLFALDRMKVMLRRYYREHGSDGWVLRLDIRRFFDSIPHDRICEMVRRRVGNRRFADMVCDIIHSFGNGRGIGLGSQISQLLAVSYLSDLDHEIKEKMHIRCYSRYSDDIVLVHPDREYLERCYARIREWFDFLGLELNPKSTMHPLRHGIVYLKFRFVLTNTGRVICYESKESIKRERRKAFRMIRLYRNGKISLEAIKRSWESWASFAMHGGDGVARIIRLKHQIERALKI